MLMACSISLSACAERTSRTEFTSLADAPMRRPITALTKRIRGTHRRSNALRFTEITAVHAQKQPQTSIHSSLCGNARRVSRFLLNQQQREVTALLLLSYDSFVFPLSLPRSVLLVNVLSQEMNSEQCWLLTKLDLKMSILAE